MAVRCTSIRGAPVSCHSSDIPPGCRAKVGAGNPASRWQQARQRRGRAYLRVFQSSGSRNHARYGCTACKGCAVMINRRNGCRAPRGRRATGHVVVRLGGVLGWRGSYPVGGSAGSFPVMLASTFAAIGLAVPGPVKLDSDPHRAVQQCLFLLGTSVNRLRNEAETGHGRPGPPRKTAPLSGLARKFVGGHAARGWAGG